MVEKWWWSIIGTLRYILFFFFLRIIIAIDFDHVLCNGIGILLFHPLPLATYNIFIHFIRSLFDRTGVEHRVSSPY